MGPAEPVTELPPLSGMDVQPVQLARRDPRDVAGLVVGCRLPADRAAEQDHLVLLPYLPVAVGNDVPWVGVDAEDAGHLHADPGFLEGFPHRTLRDRLAEFLLAHRYRPLPGIAAPLQ